MMIASKYFQGLIANDFEFEQFGYVDSPFRNTLTYLYDEKFLSKLNKNKNIIGVVTNKYLSSKIDNNKHIIVVDDPVSVFFNAFIKYVNSKSKNKTIISKSAKISPNSFIEEYDVVIEDNVVIEDGVIIKSGTIIKQNSIVRSGAIIGGEGFEIKNINGKQICIPHDGRVIIGKDVEIQYNTCIDKGMFGRDTIIGDGVKIDNLCHIAHGVQISNNCKIAAKVMIAGSCDVGSDVWIGPGSNISNGIKIGDGAKITIGSTVVKNVDKNQVVTGYFAFEHRIFLKNYLKLFRK